jgi:hypothetical protein
VLAGCGGDDTQAASPQPPRFPAAVGSDLADDAALVAASLESGDVTSARAQAQSLAADVNAAIEAGDVPRALQAPLLAAVARLLAVLPEPPPPPEKKEKEKKQKEPKPEKKTKPKKKP